MRPKRSSRGWRGQGLAGNPSNAADEQYRALKNWVLPSPDHAAFRLYADFTAANGVPSKNPLTASRIEKQIEKDDDSKIVRVRRRIEGGELIAPALDLVDVAKKLIRLGELEDLVAGCRRHSRRISIEVGVAVPDPDGEGRFRQGDRGIESDEDALRVDPRRRPMMDRWPELIVGEVAIRHPELRASVLPLLTQLVDHRRKKTFSMIWEGRVTGLRDRCQTLIDSNEIPLAGGSSPRGQWSSAFVECADAHARGPVSRWQFQDRGVSHIAGDNHDYLYFQSPLRGEFVVESELATYGWRETRMMYHGQWVGPQQTKSVVDLGNLTSNWLKSQDRTPSGI